MMTEVSDDDKFSPKSSISAEESSISAEESTLREPPQVTQQQQQADPVPSTLCQPSKEEQEEDHSNHNISKDETISSSTATFDDTDVPPEPSDNELLQDNDDVKIWFPVRRIDTHTGQCCGIMCGIWVIALIVLVIASISVGSVQFDIGVPFYDRAEINQQREDAYLATQRDADFVATVIQADSDSAPQCVHAAPTIMTRNGTLLEGPAPGRTCQLTSSTQTMRILYVSSDRKQNILTTENLDRIRQIEEEFLNHFELTKYCHLVASNYTVEPFLERSETDITSSLTNALDATESNYRSCARMTSVLNFMDDLYFDTSSGMGYHFLQEDLMPQEFDLGQDSITNVVKYWSTYNTTQTFNLSAFPVASVSVGNEVEIPNLFQAVTSTDFRQGSTEAVGVISSYNLGLPINGYSSSSQGIANQHSDTGTFLWEEFDTFFKNAGFEGVDVYVSDTANEMRAAETSALAFESFALLPASLVFVLVYLVYMQDSFFIGVVGVMQILLCFVPGLIIYTYLFQVTYLGVLNLIAIYIILGIGVDDIFVFCDQWKHHSNEKRFDQRLQKTFNVASRAMFTTSCTTFMAFISNGTSAFPAIRTFGLFAAILVLVNFCAVSFFFPAAYGLYFKYIRGKWYDHPSRLFCWNSMLWDDDVYLQNNDTQATDKGTQSTNATDAVSQPTENANDIKEACEEDAAKETDRQSGDLPEQGASQQAKESSLVRFFRDTWAPLVIKLRFVIVLVFAIIFVGAAIIAAQIEPDENSPSTLPDDNMYKQFSKVLVEHFARSGNPRAIDVHWIGGINPDEPIDRSGTDDTNTTDYGIANYVDCSVYNPTTLEAQVWSLQTCQDMFFGNISEYHSDTAEFGLDGPLGPRARKVLTDRVPLTEEWYYKLVNCPQQGLRDWLLTDNGCSKLQEYGLSCYNETSARPNCTTWSTTEGNSCEPYPVQPDKFADMFTEFLRDESVDPATRKTNYDQYYSQIFASEIPDLSEFQQDQILRDDFSCRVGDESVVLAISTTATLDQSFEQNYEEGIELYTLWEEWAHQMRKFAPREMASTMQSSSGAWSYYFLNETLLQETFVSIGLSLLLSFIVLAVIGGNPIMAFLSVATIGMIVTLIFAFTVLMGYKLGVLEAINYVVVIGLSIDYTVHLSEAYTESRATNRHDRVTLMLEEMGVSVLSGAISTLGACFFMFFAPNTFFVKFATFIFATITLSCVYSLTFFPALLAIIGPTGNTGNVHILVAKRWRQFKHSAASKYVESDEYKRREEELAQQRAQV